MKPQIHADIDSGTSPPTVGIVGGLGRMGRWFTKFFNGAGFPVLISDLHAELSSEDLARKCQVLILSLPMEAFPEVAARLGPLLPENSFMTDLCSLKQAQVACMLEHSRCEVVGTHPLFGPAEDSIKGKRVALCPGRGNKWFSWWEGLLQQHGAVTSVVSPEEHDRTMAWVQALNHFILLCLGKALGEHGMDLQQILALAPPSFEQQMNIVARLYHQDPELYATIQMSNPYTTSILETFSQYGENLKKIIKERDRSAFIKLFEEVQDLGRTILLLKKDKYGS
ncbi:MAG: prephenate dehydrogenase/arogenate dehydrogenase family protein [Deltaproteobacteria bacterium]|nr:prephenate dehydrogenase/arogenate dehydrogenase family protein [Deltaproteobacteria bacterium]MDL1960442.1 prephenate dehydrogenase/arogenate dehydrogenase family protein [Deltaproteobacteria bacterium]